MTHILNLTISFHLLLKMLLLAVSGFVLSVLLTPLYTHLAYRWQLWNRPRTMTLAGDIFTVGWYT